MLVSPLLLGHLVLGADRGLHGIANLREKTWYDIENVLGHIRENPV